MTDTYWYRWSSHKTREQAEAEIEDMHASGLLCESEPHRIRKTPTGRYAVELGEEL